MGRLQDRVAIVTGGGDGIGRAIVRRFAAEGAKVLVAEIDEDTGRAVADEAAREFDTDVRGVRTDASRKDDNLAMVEAARQTWGAVDILVNNAWGGGELSRVERKTDDGMAWAMSIGFYGPFWAMQAALPIMKSQRYGRIVNMCSLNGVNAHMGTADYNSAKEALRALTRSAAREWAPHGVVANVICPAAKSAAFRRAAQMDPQLLAGADAANPMGRVGDPEDDIAPVAVFLASEDARYVTGNTLFVDGGSHINGASWSPDLPE
jgi:NAD(P)-dependent dehydrogenase (short-subunit alcohol dehydrogenase family)